MPDAPKANDRAYWILQISGWTLFGLVNFASIASFNDTRASLWKLVAVSVIATAQMLVLTHFLRALIKRKNWIRLSYPKLALLLFGSTLALATFSQLTMSAVVMWGLRLFALEDYSLFYLGINIFQIEIWLVIWTLIYVCIHFFRDYKREEIEKWQLQASAKDAELIALKAQINPHFIFNCLNNIRALVLEDADKARDAITRLSDLLRCSLQNNQQETVPLSTELSVVKDYLALESIHMEDRLQYSITCETDADAVSLPPMSIQLLAENAIKHSLSKRPHGGRLDIGVRAQGSSIEIEVRNSGQLAAPTGPNSGIGVKNLRDRLCLIFGSSVRFTLENANTQEVVASISLQKPLPKG
ncbi:histidine kinase [Pelagicoccus sp. SDUM812003]|uniref:sensor histidine kinase n=1 Tax=Pelagicoccus sp. SDUM812003 TaxID=3041267 RepID=UPI00280DF4E1|nr:histidine kinase [Pelagicoccus sp. SDUM812003]MDQ8203414.1 histidine kinase [Pelagicoccus sp. SDUM812003]